jgi:hypothetical protein
VAKRREELFCVEEEDGIGVETVEALVAILMMIY